MEESEYETLHTENLGVHMLAGAFAGIMEHCVMYPVDFVKVYFIVSLIKIKRFHNKSDTIFLPTLYVNSCFVEETIYVRSFYNEIFVFNIYVS